MKLLNDLFAYISKIANIDIKYVALILSTLFVFVLGFIIKKASKYIIKFINDERKRYVVSQNIQIVINIIETILILFVWDEYIKSLITLISFLSAAFAIALRDIILNWFCGAYIKITKVFRVEDRIEIDGIKGDVMKISTLEFDILEVSGKENNGQSTGVIITFPNSLVFSKPLKNYTRGFKYIWGEIIVKLNLDADITKAKQEIYKIINNIDIVKNIPKKMKNQINTFNGDYRVYFNKYDPVIYTRVVDDHIELNLRYLINPKKARYIESVVWNNILISYKNGNIDLYKNI